MQPSTASFTHNNWTLTITEERINVTSERSTPNEHWRFTDSHGHEHYYDHGYPTLREVIDESHWCDGTEGIYNHDPHEAIDAAHFECTECGEVIEPMMDPPGTPKSIPGFRRIAITALRTGANYEERLTIHPDGPESQALEEAQFDPDVVQAFVDGYPSDRASRRDVVVTSAPR